jgi:hypothetical protein
MLSARRACTPPLLTRFHRVEYVFAPWDVIRITLRANSSLKAARGESVDVEPQEQGLFGAGVSMEAAAPGDE